MVRLQRFNVELCEKCIQKRAGKDFLGKKQGNNVQLCYVYDIII